MSVLRTPVLRTPARIRRPVIVASCCRARSGRSSACSRGWTQVERARASRSPSSAWPAVRRAAWSTPRSYWELLAEGRDVVGEVPPDRWDVDAFYDPDPKALGKSRTKAGGFLDDIDRFRAGLLRHLARARPRAGPAAAPAARSPPGRRSRTPPFAPDGLDGSQTGVFVGITSTDYAQPHRRRPIRRAATSTWPPAPR